MQRVVALGVADIGVRVVRDEQLNDIKIPVTRSPLHWRRDEVAAERVHFGALLEQEAACADLGVDGGPVEGRDVLLVAVGCARLPGFEELPDEGDVAALGGYKDVLDLIGEKEND